MRDERLTQWLQAACERSDAVALHGENETCSYAGLARQVDRLAHHLGESGVGAGDVVALFSPSSWLTTLLLYACSKLDAVLYPVDPKTPMQWYHRLLQQAGVDYVIQHDSVDRPFDIDVASLEIEALSGAGKQHGQAGDIAVIIATSGSGGEPKGVMLGHRALNASAGAVNAKLDLAAGDCWLNCLPLYHVGGMSIVYRTARAGAAMVLHQGFDAERVWQDINHLPVTHVSLVPAMLARLLDQANSAPPQRLKCVLVGGAALNEKLARRAVESGWPLCVTYGMSETASQVATRCIGGEEVVGQVSGYAAPLLDGIECEVIDSEGQRTAQEGQVRLRGDCLMRGYANPERVAGDGLDEAGWFTTGDIGQLDERGFLRIAGRVDETLISGGENVNPHEVEMLMLDCPGIDTVCVIGVADQVWGQKVCAVYAGPFNEREVEQWCRKEIKGALRPREFVRLSRLPRLSSGKIDRVALKQEYGA